jgi:hypothetical protein
MTYKNVFPSPEESGSRFVRSKKTGKMVDNPELNMIPDPTHSLPDPSHSLDKEDWKPSEVPTWRRILLTMALKELRVEDMPDALLDTFIWKVLEADRAEVEEIFSRVSNDYRRT